MAPAKRTRSPPLLSAPTDFLPPPAPPQRRTAVEVIDLDLDPEPALKHRRVTAASGVEVIDLDADDAPHENPPHEAPGEAEGSTDVSPGTLSPTQPPQASQSAQPSQPAQSSQPAQPVQPSQPAHLLQVFHPSHPAQPPQAPPQPETIEIIDSEAEEYDNGDNLQTAAQQNAEQNGHVANFTQLTVHPPLRQHPLPTNGTNAQSAHNTNVLSNVGEQANIAQPKPQHANSVEQPGISPENNAPQHSQARGNNTVQTLPQQTVPQQFNLPHIGAVQNVQQQQPTLLPPPSTLPLPAHIPPPQIGPTSGLAPVMHMQPQTVVQSSSIINALGQPVGPVAITTPQTTTLPLAASPHLTSSPLPSMHIPNTSSIPSVPPRQAQGQTLTQMMGTDGQLQFVYAPAMSGGPPQLPGPPVLQTPGVPSANATVSSQLPPTHGVAQSSSDLVLSSSSLVPPNAFSSAHYTQPEPLPVDSGFGGGGSANAGGLTEHGLRTLVKQHRLTADADIEAETPSEMKITLMPHQKRAVEWMTKRERPMDLGDDVVAADDECLGGILADEQGLGKTLTMIAVMLKNKPVVRFRNGIRMIDDEPASPLVVDKHSKLNSTKKSIARKIVIDDSSEEDEVSDGKSGAAKVNGRNQASGNHNSSRKEGESNETKNFPDPPWRTLVVCPLSLIHQWRKEIQDNIHENYVPSICIYHGPKRGKDSEKLKEFDIVITTYSTLSNEYPKIVKDYENELRRKANLKLLTRKPGPIFEFKWRRVVLDEAHYVKRRETHNWKAVMSLDSSMRWCLTGTPIANSVDDIYSLFCFVRYKFVPNVETWNHNWKKLLENNNEHVRNQAFKRFQTICGVVVLRRTKKDTINGQLILNLPKKLLHVVDCAFDTEIERNEYHRSSLKSIKELGDQLKEQRMAGHSGSVINYSSVLVALLRLRQKCCHPFLEEYSRINSRQVSSTRENDSNEVSQRFETPYSLQELEDAMELVEAQQSMLDIIDNSARAGVEQLLAPHEKDKHSKNVTTSTPVDYFKCEGCFTLNKRWEEGMLFSCGDRFCGNCCEKARRAGRCLKCYKPVSPDGGGEVNANELRMEVHARVLADEGELSSAGVSGRVVREWMKEEIERQRGERSEESESEDEDELDRKLTSDLKLGNNFTNCKKASTSNTNLDGVIDLDNEIVDEEKEAEGFIDDEEDEDKHTVRGNMDDGNRLQNSASNCGATIVDSELHSLHDGSNIPVHHDSDIGSAGYTQPDGSNLPKSNQVLSNLNVRRVGSGKGFSRKSDLKGKNVDEDNDDDENDEEGAMDDQERKEQAQLEARKKKILESLKRPSTKIKRIIDELNKVRDEGNNEKTLIFSQWTTMLDIVEFHILQEGHRICRLDGSMTIGEREEQIEDFKTSRRKNIMLISLKCGGTGLNLTAASRVILVDVWWNPCVEAQAIDRCHRLGQTKDVHVTKFKIAGTVEERIYKICQIKSSRVAGALGESSAKSLGRQKLSISELMKIFKQEAAHVSSAMPGSAAAQIVDNILSYPTEQTSHP